MVSFEHFSLIASLITISYKDVVKDVVYLNPIFPIGDK